MTTRKVFARLVQMVLALALIVAAACSTTTPPSPTAAPAITTAPQAAATTAPGTAAPAATTAPTVPAKPAASAEPIKIGILDDMSGWAAQSGMAFNAGSKFAIQLINDAGGIKSLGGAKLQMVLGSADGTPESATKEVERLISNEKIVALIGPTNTGETTASVPLLERYHVLSINNSVDPTNFQKGYRYVFSLAPTAQQQGEGLAKFIVWLNKNYKAPIDNMAVAYEQPSMTAMSKIAIDALTKAGAKVALDAGFESASTTDQGPLALKLKAAKISLLLYNGGPGTGPLINKALFQYDYYPWYIGNAMVTGSVVSKSAVPADVAKAVMGKPTTFAAGYFQYSDHFGKIDSVKAFFDAFLKANPDNKLDLPSIALGAQRAFTVARAIDNAASRKSEDIANALRKVVLKAPDPYLVYPDDYPELRFEESGAIATGSIAATQWKDDLSSTVAVWPDTVATAKPRQ